MTEFPGLSVYYAYYAAVHARETHMHSGAHLLRVFDVLSNTVDCAQKREAEKAGLYMYMRFCNAIAATRGSESKERYNRRATGPWLRAIPCVHNFHSFINTIQTYFCENYLALIRSRKRDERIGKTERIRSDSCTNIAQHSRLLYNFIFGVYILRESRNFSSYRHSRSPRLSC